MKDLISHVKEQYFFESERRDKLNASSAFSIGMASISGSIVASSLTNFNFPLHFWEKISILFVIIWSICIVFFGFNVERFFRGLVYKYVASAESVRRHYLELESYFASNPDETGQEAAFDEFLLDTFSRCASVNCENNDEKSRRLFMMNKWVLASVVPSILAGVSLALAAKLEPVEPQRIVIVAEPSSPSPTPTPAPRPSPPPERSVRDGSNPPPAKKN